MDTLRLAVASVSPESGGGFQVKVYVNDVEMTEKGAGLGMDPYDVLVPRNRFVAEREEQVIPVARCGCGVYGCGMTDARIRRDGDMVSWTWEQEKPTPGPLVFEAAAYEREVRRVAEDHDWENEERTAGRLVLGSVATSELPHGLRFDFVGNDWRDETVFEVCLQIPGTHQIFIPFSWAEHDPESLARDVKRVLTTEPPARWPAAWHSIDPRGGAPDLAGPNWIQRRF